MHSYEDRIRAVELYYRYGKKASVVVMERGYPSTKQLSRWVRIYEEKGDLPRELKPRERYSRAQRITAVEHYLTHGGCLSYTRRAIGYPSNEILKRWIEEFYPNARPLVIRSGTNKSFSPEERSQAVRELCNRRGTARKVAQNIGVSVLVLYKWKKDLIIDEAYQSMRKRKAAPQGNNTPLLSCSAFCMDRYIRWYNEKRIKLSLGVMSPTKYRQHLGMHHIIVQENIRHSPKSDIRILQLQH